MFNGQDTCQELGESKGKVECRRQKLPLSVKVECSGCDGSLWAGFHKQVFPSYTGNQPEDGFFQDSGLRMGSSRISACGWALPGFRPEDGFFHDSGLWMGFSRIPACGWALPGFRPVNGLL
ncbi:hypothetical protein ACOMHN_000079 [Nucella lapillus]